LARWNFLALQHALNNKSYVLIKIETMITCWTARKKSTKNEKERKWECENVKLGNEENRKWKLPVIRENIVFVSQFFTILFEPF
jgi:hypothetical protein